MWSWSAIARRLRALFARSQVEREMDDELRLHFELQARDHQQRGLDPNQAQRAAVHSFGGVDHVKEAYRDARGVRPLENLMQDIRYAIRSLIRQRTFTAAAVLTFAIGLGATTAILTLVDAAWLSWSGSYRDADRLTMLYKVFPDGGQGPTSPFDFRDWRESMRSYESMGGYMRAGARLTTTTEPTMVNIVNTTSSFFTVLGVRPAMGRFFTADEEQWGRHGVIVLSHGAWKKSFASDPAVVGRRVTLDDLPVVIVGVAPQGTWFGQNPPDVFAPLTFAPTDTRNARHSHFIFTIARLRPGASLEQARVEARGLSERVIAANPENAGTTIEVAPLDDVVLSDVKPTLRLLLWAVALLLVIACANVANLMLVRGAARHREIAVRSALGASSGRIAQQLLTESVVLAVAGGALGVVLANVILKVVGSTLPVSLPRVAETGLALDWRIAALSLLVVLASGIVVGMLPSLQMTRGLLRRDNADALREGSRGVAGGKRSAFARSSLVIAQVSVAMVLLVLSGLFARSLVLLQREDTGVRGASTVMSAFLPLPRARALDSAAHARFFDEVVRRVRDVPRVTSAGVMSHLPLVGGGETKPFWIDGREPRSNADVPTVVGRMESATSLQTIGASLVRGRWFEETDRGGAQRVAIISEGVAKRHFKDLDPIGQRISLHPPEALRPRDQLPAGGLWPRWTVIGVVKDVKYSSPRDEPEAAVYVHYPQGLQVWNWGPRWLVVRTQGDPVTSAGPIRSALRAYDATLPLGTMLPLEERMALSLRAPRFTAGLIMAFAVVAVLLGAIGLYGVIAYSVSQETRAFGVRIALGATTSDLSRHVLARGTRLAAAGIAAGLVGAFVATRWIEAQLFGVAALDPLTYGMAGALLFGLTLLASYIPARRAARVDPLIALRSD
jgi:predicted permease